MKAGLVSSAEKLTVLYYWVIGVIVAIRPKQHFECRQLLDRLPSRLYQTFM